MAPVTAGPLNSWLRMLTWPRLAGATARYVPCRFAPLAETHVIQETKTYLESQGVSLSSFSSRSRSDATILVKNIPFGTSEAQIRELFEPHGELARVLVPPAGTMAVVEYKRPDEAAKGFRAVAYRRLGNSIIYPEKGPLGMFGEGFVPKTDKQAEPVTSSSTIRVAE